MLSHSLSVWFELSLQQIVHPHDVRRVQQRMDEKRKLEEKLQQADNPL
jgi:hypothetical protein